MAFPTLTDVEHVGLVAGGIGQTPFLAYVRELLGSAVTAAEPARQAAERVSLYYGVRTADLAAGVEDFRAAGAEVHLASDDGSLGFHGLRHPVAASSRSRRSTWSAAAPSRCCTPWPTWPGAGSVPCHLSLETPMACGVGICFSCVTRVPHAGRLGLSPRLRRGAGL